MMYSMSGLAASLSSCIQYSDENNTLIVNKVCAFISFTWLCNGLAYRLECESQELETFTDKDNPLNITEALVPQASLLCWMIWSIWFPMLDDKVF